MTRLGCIAILVAVAGAHPAAAQQPATLFAAEAPLRIMIAGPVSRIARNAADSVAPHPATLTEASGAAHPIRLSARGISRRKGGFCDFPPLRVEFSAPPPAASPFAGQHRLKLVTHCQAGESYHQRVLLEYSAYRLFNLMSPLSFGARLALIDYRDDGGRGFSRYGFFIEDFDHSAKRNGLSRAASGDRIAASQLEPRQSARVALFQYMIGNLDWSMRAGPQGAGCCHNGRLARAGARFAPVPYDFDHSGLVDAPYAEPPEGLRVNSVRQRLYRGYCAHNAQLLAAATELRARRGQAEAIFANLPGLESRTQRKALAYLADFFDDIATDQSVRKKLLADCLN
ncbi:hypothetical protein [Sphingomonas xanthus]|uniref:Uncharacterized protein n=1 Tax=Sphingomonas xanthus TaxID=2594473 RepID=A0A516IPZ1_9SPHN|nr:hypothetical protein [Sphingomonas xanthus]QDP18990.1 hypothetical protein FMM02_02855 [Sphingomonas xanthus]